VVIATADPDALAAVVQFLNFRSQSIKPEIRRPSTKRLRQSHCKPLSTHFAHRVLKAENDANYRTIPKRRSWSIFPVRAGWIQNRFVPVKPF